MSHVFAIIEQTGNRSVTLQGMGSSRGIGENLILRCDNGNEFYATWKCSWEMLPIASVILTRHKDSNWASHETNKLYSALNEYRYFVMTYEQADKLDNVKEFSMLPFEVNCQMFNQLLFSSEMFKVIQQASTLTERLPRQPVTLNVSVGDTCWCYTTDLYHPKDNMNEQSIIIPLDIDTDNVKDYITEVIGKDYKFGGD